MVKAYLGVADVAKELGVTPGTVRHWCNKTPPWIKYEWRQVGKRRIRTFTPSAVESFKRRSRTPDSPVRSQSRLLEEFINTLESALSKESPGKADARRVHRALQAITDDSKESR